MILNELYSRPFSAPPSAGSCPAFKLSQHLVMNISDESRSVGTKVTFSCGPGFLLNGSEFITCTQKGIWNDKMPSCTGELRLNW